MPLSIHMGVSNLEKTSPEPYFFLPAYKASFFEISLAPDVGILVQKSLPSQNVDLVEPWLENLLLSDDIHFLENFELKVSVPLLLLDVRFPAVKDQFASVAIKVLYASLRNQLLPFPSLYVLQKAPKGYFLEKLSSYLFTQLDFSRQKSPLF